MAAEIFRKTRLHHDNFHECLPVYAATNLLYSPTANCVGIELNSQRCIMDSGKNMKRVTRREILQGAGALAGGWALWHIFPESMAAASPAFVRPAAAAV